MDTPRWERRWRTGTWIVSMIATAPFVAGAVYMIEVGFFDPIGPADVCVLLAYCVAPGVGVWAVSWSIRLLIRKCRKHRW